MDRAALDVALELGLAHGGWCPRGRRAEGGTVPLRYALQETPSSRYEQRTRWNVRDSDGTLILTRGPLTGGTALTARAADAAGRPLLIVDLLEAEDPSLARDWVARQSIRTLNVAGPRESGSPGIGAAAASFLRALLSEGEGRDPI